MNMKICSSSKTNECSQNEYCNMVTHLCESCHIICDLKRGIRTECKDFCPDMYRTKAKNLERSKNKSLIKGEPLIGLKELPFESLTTEPPQSGEPRTAEVGQRGVLLILLTSVTVTIVLILMVLVAAVYCSLVNCLTSSRSTKKGSGNVEANILNKPDEVPRIKRCVNEQMLLKEVTKQHPSNPQLVDCGVEANETTTMLTDREIDCPGAKGSRLSENASPYAGNQSINSSENSPIIKPHINESDVVEIPVTRSRGDVCAIHTHGRNVSLNKANNVPNQAATPNKSTLDVKQSSTQIVKENTLPKNETEDVCRTRTAIPEAESQPDRINRPAEAVQFEIEGFYCPYHKSNDASPAPPTKTSKFRDVSLLEAQKDEQLDQEEVQLMSNLLHSKQTVENKKEAALSVITMRKYNEEESEDSGRGGSDETLLKNEDPVQSCHPVQPPNLVKSLHKTVEHLPHPNIRLYGILNKISWIQSIYSEGESIIVYVDYNDISSEVALRELASQTGCEPNKFHVKHKEWNFPPAFA